MTNKMTMLDYIHETAVVGKTLISNKEKAVGPLVRYFKQKRYNKILIIASGSSFNASTTARLYMEKNLSMEVKVIAPFTFEHYENNLSEDTFVFAISQSGRSTNIISALKKLKALGRETIVLTGFPDSEVKNYSNGVIDLNIGIETVGYVTKGYTTTVLFLMLFSLIAAKELGFINHQDALKDENEMLSALTLHPEAIKQSIDFYNRHKSTFLRMKRLQICGYGPNHGTSIEGALKIGETFGIPATSYELEEFMHGGYLELTPENVVILIDSDGKGHSRTLEVYEALKIVTKNAFIIGSVQLPEEDHILRLNHSLDEYISPLLLVLLFQVLSYMICTDLDIWLKENYIEAFEKRIHSKTEKPAYLKV